MKTAPQIYSKLLSAKGYGYPLWFPEPEYGEVRVGDVGYFTTESSFRRLFNIFETVDDQKEEFAKGVPEGFEPILWGKKCIKFHPNFYTTPELIYEGSKREGISPSGGLDAASSLNIGGSLKHQKLKDHSAKLGTKCPPHRSIMPDNKCFSGYFKRKYKAFHRWATSDQGEVTKSIVLVQGVIKAPHFRTEVSQRKQTITQPELNFGTQAAAVEGNVSVQLERTTSANQGTEMREEPLAFVPPPSPPAKPTSMPDAWDKTLFVPHWRLKKKFLLVPVMKASAGPHQLPPAPDPALAPGVEADGEVYTPLDALLDYILENSSAEEAIASDGCLEELFGHGTEIIPEEVTEYLRQHPPVIEVDEDGIGSLSLGDLLLKSFLKRANHTLGGSSPSSSGSSGPINKQVKDGTLVVPTFNNQAKEYNWPHFALATEEAQGEAGPQASVALSPNDPSIAVTGGENGVLNVWDLETGLPLEKYERHEDSVSSLLFSPDGTKLVTFSEELVLVMWDVTNGRELAEKGEIGESLPYVLAMEFSPDSKLLATSHNNRDIRIWDAVTLEELPGLGDRRRQRNPVMSLAFSPNGELLATAGWDRVSLWNPRTGEAVGELTGHTSLINCLNFSPDGRRLITGSDDRSAKIWDVATRMEIGNVSGLEGGVFATEFSPDSTKAAIGAQDRRIVVVESATSDILHEFTDNFRQVSALAWSRDGSFLASACQSTGSAGGEVKVWSMSSGILATTFKGHGDSIKQLNFTADDEKVATYSDGDGAPHIWEVERAIRLVERF